MSETTSPVPRPAARIALWCSVGVALRLVFLFVAGNIDFTADEGFYVHSALAWNAYGFYPDQYRYLWPPGYPFFLGRCLAWFGSDGIFVAKLVQVLASASVGASVMSFANRLFGARALTLAGLGWALYLPLIGFTHTLWPETLFLAFFLPALRLLATVLEHPERSDAGPRLIAAGAALALALYLKQAALWLVPLLIALLAWRSRGPLLQRAWAPLLFALSVAVPILPWTLRNAEVYAAIVPLGSTLGENAFRGLNAEYTNFDTVLIASQLRERGLPAPAPRAWLVATETPGWKRPEELVSTVARQRESLARGLDFARDDPAWFARSRVQKLADWVTPITFFLRHQALGLYRPTALHGAALRRPLSVWALLCPLLAMSLAIAGWTRLERGTHAWLIGIVIVYFASTALLVSMSRFRLPIVPLLIVLASGAFGGNEDRRRRIAAAILYGLLALLWWIGMPALAAVAREAWGGAP